MACILLMYSSMQTTQYKTVIVKVDGYTIGMQIMSVNTLKAHAANGRVTVLANGQTVVNL